MSEIVDYTVVRDDLKRRIEDLQTALAAVEGILASVGSPAGSGGAVKNDRDDFLGLTIPDAAKKYLERVRSAQTISQIHEGIRKGGLAHTQYNAVYTAIWRREYPEGVFAKQPNSDTLWGLAEWWLSNLTAKKATKKAGKVKPSKAKKTSAKKPTKKPGGGVTLLDATAQLLTDENAPLHMSTILERLAQRFNKVTKRRSLSSSLPQDSKKRFENLGNNWWVLAEWPLAQKQIPQA